MGYVFIGRREGGMQGAGNKWDRITGIKGETRSQTRRCNESQSGKRVNEKKGKERDRQRESQ